MRLEDSWESISGRAAGVLAFTLFGGIWLVVSLRAFEWLDPPSITAVGLIVFGLAVPAIVLRRRVPVITDPMAQGAGDAAHARRVFAIVNVAQAVGMVLAITMLNAARRPEWIVPVLASIVGLHLFPLARVFSYRPHNVTGVLLVVWSLGVLLLVQTERMSGIGAMGAAVILLVSAVYTLARAYVAARELGGTEAVIHHA